MIVYKLIEMSICEILKQKYEQSLTLLTEK